MCRSGAALKTLQNFVFRQTTHFRAVPRTAQPKCVEVGACIGRLEHTIWPIRWYECRRTTTIRLCAALTPTRRLRALPQYRIGRLVVPRKDDLSFRRTRN